MNRHQREADLAFALELADAAASVTLPGFGKRHDVRLKTDDTPVTELDGRAEDVVRALVAERFPHDGVHGEEGGLEPGRSGRVWIVDPIDGTKMFAEGIPLWTTLIALRDGDQVVTAVADAPALHERFHAVRGGGAWSGRHRLKVSDVDRVCDALVLHAALEEFTRDGGTGTDPLLRLADAARGTRGIGDGWAHLVVARGAAEALVEQGPCFEWDWAATGLIVEEAGGRLTRLEGGPPVPGGHLLVTNGQVDDELREVLGTG